MPPQGPPGPQPQPAERVAAAAMSAPAAAAAAGAGAANDSRQQLAGDDGLAPLASRVANGSSDGYDQSVLRRRRDPDGDQVFCPPEDASPVQDGAKGASSVSSAATGNNGYVQAKPAAPRCDEDPQPDEREVSKRGLLETVAADGKPKLLTFDDVPQHLQFNPYIVTGYRPMCNFWGSLRSLFYLHNETVNIITHGIPIVYILLVVPGLVPWARLDRHGHFLAWCHLVGAVSPWVGSFVYHLFMNLQAGERVYNRLLRLDMFGIWICQSFGALPMVTATVYCLPWNVRWLVISSYCLLSLCGLYKAMTAWSPWDRRLSFALPWVSRLALCLVRAVLGGGSPHNMLHLILQDSVSLVGGVVGAVYFPEKYFPGWVDYCLNSHNIMHILTVAAVYSMHCATIQDLEWIASVDCKPAGPPWPPWGSWAPGPLGAANQTAEL